MRQLSDQILRSVAVFALLSVTHARAQSRLQPIGAASPSQTVQFDIFLPLQNSDQLDQLISAQHSSGSSQYQQWMPAQDFRSRFGPSAAQVAAIAAALKPFGLQITKTHSHGVRVQGTVNGIQSAFGVTLSRALLPKGGQTLVSTQPLKMPAQLQQLRAGIAAFSPTIHVRPNSMRTNVMPDNRYSPVGPYWFDDLKQAYEYPSYQKLTGKGRTIAIVMSNDFLDSDMDSYFGHEKLATPKIVRMPIDGGAPFDPGASFETSLDIQQSGGMAPRATIVHYNIPDLSDQSILDAYTSIVDNNAADIVNSSFSGPEGFFTAPYNGGVDFTWELQIFEDVFKQGNAQGITFVASSGDKGGLPLPSLECVSGKPSVFLPGVEWLASSPHVTGVGGTNLTTTSNPPDLTSKYISENANGDALAPYDPFGCGADISGGYWGSCGGASVIFPKPLFQYLVNTGASTRAVPDVSLQMGGCPFGTLSDCPADRSFSIVLVGGSLFGVIGTSISSPDFAGLLALEEQHLGTRLGNVNYQIYALAAAQNAGIYKAFHQGIPGFNGFDYSHQGVKGYNMVVGNGTAIGRNLILAPLVPAAGTPQTPSNP